MVLHTLCDVFLNQKYCQQRPFFPKTKVHPATVTVSLTVTESNPKTVKVSFFSVISEISSGFLMYAINQ